MASSKFYVSPADCSRKTRVRHKPQRSFKEFCVEFGVSIGTLAGYLGNYGGPAPSLKCVSEHGSNSWYDPDVMRAWWKALQKSGHLRKECSVVK